MDAYKYNIPHPLHMHMCAYVYVGMFNSPDLISNHSPLV